MSRVAPADHGQHGPGEHQHAQEQTSHFQEQRPDPVARRHGTHQGASEHQNAQGTQAHGRPTQVQSKIGHDQGRGDQDGKGDAVGNAILRGGEARAVARQQDESQRREEKEFEHHERQNQLMVPVHEAHEIKDEEACRDPRRRHLHREGQMTSQQSFHEKNRADRDQDRGREREDEQRAIRAQYPKPSSHQ